MESLQNSPNDSTIILHDLAEDAYRYIGQANVVLRNAIYVPAVFLARQEVEPTLGWWLLDNLNVDFLGQNTSDMRLSCPATYIYDEQNAHLHDPMACPALLARKWTVDFLRTDRQPNLEKLFYSACAYSKGLPCDGRSRLADLRCLGGLFDLSLDSSTASPIGIGTLAAKAHSPGSDPDAS